MKYDRASRAHGALAWGPPSIACAELRLSPECLKIRSTSETWISTELETPLDRLGGAVAERAQRDIVWQLELVRDLPKTTAAERPYDATPAPSSTADSRLRNGGHTNRQLDLIGPRERAEERHYPGWIRDHDPSVASAGPGCPRQELNLCTRFRKVLYGPSQRLG